MSKEEKINKHQYNILDKGFLYLLDYMGTDAEIAKSARVSYDKKVVSNAEQDEHLIRYMMRHKHTSPFEMAEIKVHAKMPIFVARQWIRHRTANINEKSGRYSELDNDFFNPTQFRKQSKTNKQGSNREIYNHKIESFDKSFTEYQSLLNNGVSKEMARIVLPLATYTEWYWKIDLHNLMHFLSLRLDAHAQYEIRVYAQVLAKIVADLFPMSWKAFEDYSTKAITFSRGELEVLRTLFDPHKKINLKDNCRDNDMSQREIAEFQRKLKKMGIKV